MKRNKQLREVADIRDNQVHITSISFNMESEFHNEIENKHDSMRGPIERQSSRTKKQLTYSVIEEPLELTSFPLGLMEDDDSLVRSVTSVRQRNETERIFLSSHRPLAELRTNNISANGLPDIPEFSSTNDLTPLSIAAFKDEKSQRIIWLDNASLMAMSLALSNIWRLPTFVYFNYSGEAFIAYIILMVFVGLPLFVLELSLGQFGQTGVIQLWRAVPFFKGIGIAQVIAGIYQACYFPTLATWAFQFGIVGFSGWSGCELSSSQNLTTCLCQDPQSSNCTSYGVISEEEFCFENRVLYKYQDLMNFKMLPMLAAVLIIVALSICFGAKVMKIILSLSGIISAILLGVVMALALSHPNNLLSNVNNTAQRGINLLVPHELWGFGRGEVWYGAMVQVLFSLAIGFGTLPTLTSSSYFNRNIVRDGILIWLINLFFAIISVITAFAWIGISGLDGNDVAQPNAFIYSVYYNVSDSLWAGLTFGLIFLAGINSMLPLSYAIFQNVYENFPALKEHHRKLTYCLVFLAIWLVNVPGLIPAGNEILTMWDHYAAGGTVLTCLIVHLIGWMWVYGRENVKKNLEFMLSRPINFFWNVSWSYVTIVLLLVAELWGFLGVPLDGTVDCHYPIWLVATGWSLYFLALVVAIIFMIRVVVHETEYELIKKLVNSMKPDRNWGPVDPLLHFHWKRSIEQESGPVSYSLNTISRRLKDESPTLDISNSDHNATPKNRRPSITMVRMPNYARHYDELGGTIA
ncbi:sodium-dependent noradrenaline transporter-like isoform X3 [Daphnia carinata]|uniref:sodium-dependent noradrenaline transporter-like isoform X3 n=1 Tax=Daphnia carinata TaxID=120202 RepID=UPI00257E20B2|nr:sodium-dependent noradrenaline transporter-like isoform X3 [Daphnia carinata]